MYVSMFVPRSFEFVSLGTHIYSSSYHSMCISCFVHSYTNFLQLKITSSTACGKAGEGGKEGERGEKGGEKRGKEEREEAKEGMLFDML